MYVERARIQNFKSWNSARQFKTKFNLTKITGYTVFIYFVIQDLQEEIAL